MRVYNNISVFTRRYTPTNRLARSREDADDQRPLRDKLPGACKSSMHDTIPAQLDIIEIIIH
jgi:hypothetical protein